MIIKKIEQSEVTHDDIKSFRASLPTIDTVSLHPTPGYTAPEFGINKRIIALYSATDETFILVNPEIVEVGNPIVFYEFDDFVNFKTLKTLPKNPRKTIRYDYLKIKTDNMDFIEFSSSEKKWQDLKDMYNDSGLIDCINVYRLIDSINGISIKERKYSQTVTKKFTYGRNERVMLQSPKDKSMIFVKWKDSDEYLKKGYEII
jgi:hypothetical protein